MKREHLLLVYIFLFTAVLLAAALVFPGNNWDAIGYAAAAKSYDIGDKAELHTFVYDELRKSVGEEGYRDLTTGTFEETVSKDPESLQQVLPFYRLRPVYVAAIYLLSKIGVDLFFAAHLVTALAVVLGLWVFYLAVRERIDHYLLFMLPIFAVAFGAWQVSRIGTPDGLAFLVVALIFYLFLKDSWAVLIVLPLALMVRTDLIIFVLLLLVFLFVTHRRWRIGIALAVALSVALYAGTNLAFGGYRFATLFWVTFVESVRYPEELEASLSWAIYGRVLRQGLLDMLHYYTSFLAYGALVALTVLLFLRMRGQDRGVARAQWSALVFSLIAFTSVVIHFLLFPAMWPRFFIGQYFIGALVLLIVLTVALDARVRAE